MTSAMINESALQFVNVPYTQNLVTIESCKAYIQQTADWNIYLKIIATIAVVMMFYYMYKQGRFDKEKKLLQSTFKEDEKNENVKRESGSVSGTKEKETDRARDSESDERR